ncbi:MAG: hypothetical protein OXC95_18675 [Dehalococcoidia bacterium]|nr:hypothetical protein [Dehalococcoidia bacterium]
MGYETFMELEIDGPEQADNAARKLAEITGTDEDIWGNLISTGTHMKWYEHTEEMKKLSLRCPDTLFTLRGLGEEPSDQWVEYHRNGRTHIERMPEWNPPPFDPDKLA